MCRIGIFNALFFPRHRPPLSALHAWRAARLALCALGARWRGVGGRVGTPSVAQAVRPLGYEGKSNHNQHQLFSNKCRKINDVSL